LNYSPLIVLPVIQIRRYFLRLKCVAPAVNAIG